MQAFLALFVALLSVANGEPRLLTHLQRALTDRSRAGHALSQPSSLTSHEQRARSKSPSSNVRGIPVEPCSHTPPVACAAGFVLAPFVARAPTRAASIPMMGVEDAAAKCLEEECSLDTIDDLIAEMTKEVSSMTMTLPLSQRQRSVLATLQQLKTIGSKADKSTLQAIIEAAARSFAVVENFNFPGEPLGYTGTVGTQTIAGRVFDKK